LRQGTALLEFPRPLASSPQSPRAGANAVLLVIAVAIVATGLWLFVAGLFFESETNIWLVISGGWLIGLGGDQLWRNFLAPSWVSKKVERR
jgi:hypothetical protein